ncbi:MAG: phage capsid protein, partial [Lachnospiraceae bacterium]|nr:phage capsid protein [Lachnospiraceae bacterium]
MSETVNQDTQQTAAEPERTFTQSEMDAIIRDRLKREREKYADYDALKEKAGRFDAAEEAQKSELQKATERADALQAQLDSMLKADNVRKIRE